MTATAQPIRKVVLTTAPRVYTYDRGLRIFHLGVGRRRHQFRDLFDIGYTIEELRRRLLAAECPGVTFELPLAIQYHGSDDTYVPDLAVDGDVQNAPEIT